jgi:hypothetical protein
MTGDITIEPGKPAYISLTLSDALGIANFSEATITFTVGDISKSTADNTIFFAHPIFQAPNATVPDPVPPCFIIRLFPEDIIALGQD